MIPSLAAVVSVVEAEGERLSAEFHRPGGPRGARGKAPVDVEIENRLRDALLSLVPGTFAGEETGTSVSGRNAWTWLVDPHDGTHEFLSGRRGSAIAVALLRGCEPVLAVVHAPLSPDRGRDTVAWREGEPLARNGRPVEIDLSRKRLAEGELVWATASSALRPRAFSRAVAPARYVAMPSIAYRLARVAAGDGVAALSLHSVNEYDIAAGMALVRAAGGVTLDAEGREVALAGSCDVRVSGCFSGSRSAVEKLARFPWGELEKEKRSPARVSLGFPRRDDEAGLSRAQGVFLEEIINGAEHALAAVMLARAIVSNGGYAKGRAQAAYREFGAGDPLARAAAIGIWAAGDPARAARTAREDAALTHPQSVDACAARAAEVASGIADRSQPGREAIPSGLLLPLLASRPPDRAMELWTDDVLELAEALYLLASPS